MPVLAPKRLFTVDEYYQMAKANILREDDRVELIEGEIVQMTPIGSRHAACVMRLNAFFSGHFSSMAAICVQSPIHLGEFSEPEPDIVLVKLRDDFYETALPMPSDIFLIIEVADTSLRYDQMNKIPLYGRAGVPESWLVDLENRTVEVYSQSLKDGYQQKQVYQYGQTVSPAAFPELEIAVQDIFE